jgi:hypothetical protein
MTIFGISNTALGNPDHLGNDRFDPPSGTIDFGQQRRQLARPKTIKVGKLRHIDRTHVPTLPKGCHTVAPPGRCQAV